MLNPEVADTLLAAAYKWTESGSILKISSWTTDDAVTSMAEGTPNSQQERNVNQIFCQSECTGAAPKWYKNKIIREIGSSR